MDRAAHAFTGRTLYNEYREAEYEMFRETRPWEALPQRDHEVWMLMAKFVNNKIKAALDELEAEHVLSND